MRGLAPHPLLCLSHALSRCPENLPVLVLSLPGWPPPEGLPDAVPRCTAGLLGASSPDPAPLRPWGLHVREPSIFQWWAFCARLSPWVLCPWTAIHAGVCAGLHRVATGSGASVAWVLPPGESGPAFGRPLRDRAALESFYAEVLSSTASVHSTPTPVFFA